MPDGAQRALMGYLYQFVGAAGLAARSRSHAGKSPRRVQKLFETYFGSTVFHEADDMDAVAVKPDGSAVGFQYKYSLNNPPTAIEPAELRGILDAMHRSANRPAGFQFAEYVLVSNRALSPHARKLYETRGQATPDRKLYPLQPAITTADRAALKQFGDPKSAAQARHEILGKLELHLAGDYRDWVHEVKEHARIHGVLPGEFERAFETLVGSIFSRAVGSALELTVEFLNGSLLGIPDARPLMPSKGVESARHAAASSHLDFVSHTFVGDLARITPRRSLLQLLDDEVSVKSLVFVYGEGGSGKSVLAAEYLRQNAITRCVGAVIASDLAEGWPGRSFNAWRSHGHQDKLTIEPIEGILDRLRNAGPSEPRPILLLDVDGVDEVGPDHRHAIRTIIQKFYGRPESTPPETVLIVTCRGGAGDSEADFQDLLREWLATEIPDEHGDRVGRVAVPGFDLQDLLDSAAALGDEYRSRIGRFFDLISSGSNGPFVLGDGDRRGNPLSSRPDFVESFLHPAMWQSFVGLDDAERRKVLDQDAPAVGKLASRFLDRFCFKVHRRHQRLSRPHIIQALSAIGRGLASHGETFERQGDWLQPACGPVSDYEAALLYDEAISYGLIREEGPGRWGWRHGLVGDHLRET